MGLTRFALHRGKVIASIDDTYVDIAGQKVPAASREAVPFSLSSQGSVNQITLSEEEFVKAYDNLMEWHTGRRQHTFTIARALVTLDEETSSMWGTCPEAVLTFIAKYGTGT